MCLLNALAGLPYRFLSSDGFCAIDIVSKPGAISDRASLWEIKQAAFQIIAQCAQGNPSTGGIVRQIGIKNKLAVIVRPYVRKPCLISQTSAGITSQVADRVCAKDI